MPLLFWIEIGAYTLAAVSALALAMMVLGTGPRRTLNRLFAVFVTLEAVWAVSAVLLRVMLWLDTGNPTFWLELAAVALNAMGVILPVFAVRYVGRSTQHADLVVGLGLLALVGLAIPTFNHRFLVNPRLAPNGVGTYDVLDWGFIAPLLPIPYFVWSFVLFWRNRRETRATYLAIGVLILLVGFLIGGMLRPYFPAPVLSITVTLSVGVLGYGIVSKQLLNPLRELTTELEQKVEARTRELAETAGRLEEANVALEERGARLRTSAQIAREAAAIHDVEQLLDETVRLISDRFGFYHAGIFLLDETNDYAVLRAASSEGGQRMLARGHQLRVGQEGIVGYVAGQGEPRIALDVGVDAVFFDNPDLPETRSEVALPLEARGETVGALDVQSREPGAFADEDVEVLQTLADQVAIAIDNARLFQQAQEALEAERRAYGELSRQAWERLLSADREWEARYDPHGVMSGEQERRDALEQAVRLGQPICGDELGDVAHPREASDGAGSMETLVVPIKVRGHVIGVLDARKSGQAGADAEPWMPDEIALMESLGQQLGVALESARLYQDVQRRAVRERIVSKVAARMRQSLDMTTVLKAGAEGIRDALGLPGVTVRLMDGDERRPAEAS
jgi:GAF domain-containing protein